MTAPDILEVLIGVPLVLAGFSLSTWALRRPDEGYDAFGFLMFLSGGVIMAAGVMLMVHP